MALGRIAGVTQPSQNVVAQEREASLYDRDFVAWAMHTAAMLRARRFDAVEVSRLAEEIEDMCKRDMKELNGRLQVLLAHLLKWQRQPHRRSRSWRATIVAQRLEIDALLRDSPSLRRRISSELVYNYGGALKRAAAETGLNPGAFPARCPFTTRQILDHEFLP